MRPNIHPYGMCVCVYAKVSNVKRKSYQRYTRIFLNMHAKEKENERKKTGFVSSANYYMHSPRCSDDQMVGEVSMFSVYVCIMYYGMYMGEADAENREKNGIQMLFHQKRHKHHQVICFAHVIRLRAS